MIVQDTSPPKLHTPHQFTYQVTVLSASANSGAASKFTRWWKLLDLGPFGIILSREGVLFVFFFYNGDGLADMCVSGLVGGNERMEWGWEYWGREVRKEDCWWLQTTELNGEEKEVTFHPEDVCELLPSPKKDKGSVEVRGSRFMNLRVVRFLLGGLVWFLHLKHAIYVLSYLVPNFNTFFSNKKRASYTALKPQKWTPEESILLKCVFQWIEETCVYYIRKSWYPSVENSKKTSEIFLLRSAIGIDLTWLGKKLQDLLISTWEMRRCWFCVKSSRSCFYWIWSIDWSLIFGGKK